MSDGYTNSGQSPPEAEPRGDMRKIYGLLIALAIFLVILIAYIVPQQGGLTSSTSIFSSELASANPAYEEQMPIQLVDLGSSGRSIFIAFVMLSHVVFANLHLGGAWVILATIVLWFLSRQTRYLHLGRSLLLFNVILFSAGATYAVGGMTFFISLFPTFAVNAFHIYWWPLFIEAMTFGAEIFFLYTLWFSWGKIKPVWTIVLAVFYPLDVFLQTTLIDTIAAGMLTPAAGATGINWLNETSCFFCMPFANYMNWWFNATIWPLQFHRVAAAASFFGFMIAFFAMLHFYDQKDSSSKRFWDWAGSYGILWGMLGLVFQPVFGLWYMFTIFTKQPQAFSMIMTGPRAWEMLMMLALLTFLLLFVLVYYIERRDRVLRQPENRRIRRIFRAFIAVIAAIGFFLVNPAWLGGVTSKYDPSAIINPFGFMYWKFIALIILIGVALVMLGIDALILGRRMESEWGSITHSSRWAGAVAGVLGSGIIVVMGYVRESSRSPWLIYNIVPVPGGQQFPTPVPMPQIFVIWGVILALIWAIFWFTTKVTAEHPETKEEV